ncbi:histone deacetylase family protein [Alienimonas californiensis]|uniref:Histone deacetylase-like amidohydrolase n=1 Tax=Alienimonas californiensis TaxID=2527989 RepID=A0A517P7Y0_9PLAN|nr:histone deacetylase [Alienimonas californiensis]QDT15472.1 Histone deacetylase-like amidohydrolase [Alienimonas californiensis]
MNLLFHTPGHAEHDPTALSPGHPERPARLDALAPVLEQAAAQGWTRREHAPATDAALVRLHPAAHLEWLSALANGGGGRAEADTALTPGSMNAARSAAGAGLSAVDAAVAGEGVRAFCAVRPPGHHARPFVDRGAMGFCLLANAALAAAHARAAHGLDRVLVIDWDVHHGNGTQDAFYADPNVHFLSLHRFPFYPGSGAQDETGAGAGLGTTRNLPIAFGTPADTIVGRFRTALGDVADACRPELVILSAGFDARRGDPVGDLGLELEHFAALTAAVVEVAETHAGGRVVSLLEGGYDPAQLAEGVTTHLTALAAGDASSD